MHGFTLIVSLISEALKCKNSASAGTSRDRYCKRDILYERLYRGADTSLAPPTYRRILFDGENISFDASLVIYINSTNSPPIIIINRTYENQNFLSL
jgi:hypothetical protein